MVTTLCFLLFIAEYFCKTEGSELADSFSIQDLHRKITVRFCLQLYGLPAEITDRISECTTKPDFDVPGDLALVGNAIRVSTTRLSTLLRFSVRSTQRT